MNDNQYMTPKYAAEVKQWLHQLLASTGQPRQQAAEELSRLGVWTRGSVLPRGKLPRSARWSPL